MLIQKGQHLSPKTEYKTGNIPWIANKYHIKKTRLKISLKKLGKSSPLKGKTWEERFGTEEAQRMKKKLSLKHEGIKLSVEHRLKLSQSKFGHEVSKETKNKIGASNKISLKKYWDKHPEAKESLSKSQFGKKASIQTREKMSRKAKENGIGKWNKDRKWDEKRKRKWGIKIKEEYKIGNRKSWNKGRKMTLEERKKLSNAKRKKWDLSGRKRKIKRAHHTNNQIEYIEWRKSVFQGDDWICQKCERKSGIRRPIYLVAHHKESWADYPNLRYKTDNGITLCRGCHIKFHNKYGRKSNTSQQSEEFLNQETCSEAA